MRDYANSNDQPIFANNERNIIRKSILPFTWSLKNSEVEKKSLKNIEFGVENVKE